MKPSSQQLFEQIFGNDAKQKLKDLEAIDPDFVKLVEEVAMDKIWARPGLTLRDRSLITIASQVALERWDQVKIHMDGFNQRGGKPEELRELLLHLSIYCGFPATLAGLTILNDWKAK